jgi:hypothetical protein
MQSHILEKARHPPPHLFAQVQHRIRIGGIGDRVAHVNGPLASDLLTPGVVHVFDNRPLRKAPELAENLGPKR